MVPGSSALMPLRRGAKNTNSFVSSRLSCSSRDQIWAGVPKPARNWTDEGTARQERGLKHRADNETRTIPIPPVLVGLLRAHVKRFGTTLDGQVFQTARGGILQDSGYNEVWDQARREALTPAQYRSPLGRRPYDLRHAAVSLWLNSGVPATEVARRAGHGVAVLLKIYAHCIDGQATAANQRIAEALGTQDAEEDPGDEGGGDTEQACGLRTGRDRRRPGIDTPSPPSPRNWKTTLASLTAHASRTRTRPGGGGRRSRLSARRWSAARRRWRAPAGWRWGASTGWRRGAPARGR
jgi:hypothetical protein